MQLFAGCPRPGFERMRRQYVVKAACSHYPWTLATQSVRLFPAVEPLFPMEPPGDEGSQARRPGSTTLLSYREIHGEGVQSTGRPWGDGLPPARRSGGNTG